NVHRAPFCGLSIIKANMNKGLIRLGAAFVLGLGSVGRAQDWNGPVRESWVRQGGRQDGDVTLVQGKVAEQLVVASTEHSAVQQAAVFLAGDIEKIAGVRPAIVKDAGDAAGSIHL